MSDAQAFMRRAIELSRDNVKRGGGPFGAVIVKDGRIVGEGANRVTASNDPTAHAEVTAIANTKVDAAAIEFDDHFIYDELAKDASRRAIPMTGMLRDEALAAFRDWQANAARVRY